MIRNQITLKQIEALVYVADLGTFRKAASALGTTQPNISVRIAAMEDTLGLKLMHRDAGAVRLTHKGRDILAAARDVLRSTETLLDAAGRRDLIEEKLRLGVTELVASTWLQDFLRALKKTYPAVRVELTVDLSRVIQEQMAAGDIDLGILTDQEQTKSFTRLDLGTCRYGWFTSPAVAATLGAAPDIAELVASGVLTHGKHTLASKALRDHVASLGGPLDVITHSSSLTALMHMAADGMGIATLPRQLTKDYVRSNRLVELSCPWVPPPLAFSASYSTQSAPLYVAQAAEMAVQIAQASRE